MTNDYVLKALYADTINTAELAGLAEAKVQEQPNNAAIRAHLLHYYHHIETYYGQREVSEGRLRHIEWFINNHPDLEFCGTAPFYDRASSSNFGFINRLWQEAISNSHEEMRKVNACMNLANSDRPAALSLIEKQFLPSSKNLWVLALRDFLNESGRCFNSVVALERSNPEVMDDSYRARLQIELKEIRDWESFALRDLESRGYDATNILETLSTEPCDPVARSDDASHMFKTHFSSSMSVKAAAKIAGSTLYSFESASVVHFNPEILSMRFQLACWITRHLPSSKLAISRIFVGPFVSPGSYIVCDGYFKPLECLYDYLAELWIEQLIRFPADKKVASNAATLAIKWEGYFPTAAKIVVSKLSQTNIGKAALEKCKTR